MIASLSNERGTLIPSILMHSPRTTRRGISMSFIAASTVSSPIDLTSVSPSIPARSESAASRCFAVIAFSFLMVMFTSVLGCFSR